MTNHCITPEKQIIYKKILSLFVARNSEREWMNEPFNWGNRNGSGDFHSLVTTPKIDEFPQIPRPPNNYPTQKSRSYYFLLAELKDLLNQIPQVDCFDEETCSACDEDGKADYSFCHKEQTYLQRVMVPELY